MILLESQLNNLKLLRTEKGVSQQNVADAIGTDQQSICCYEKGKYEPDIQTLKALADYFDTSVDYIIGRTDIRNRIEKVEKYALNKEESELIDRFREFSPEYKKSHLKMLHALAETYRK